MRSEQLVIPHFRPRRVRTVLPPDHRPGEPRPLLILFDGQNVLGDRGSFAGGWHADRAVSRLAAARPRPILVAIDHGHGDRIAELSPYPVVHHERSVAGRGHAFLQWMAEVWVPRLRQRHAVIDGPAGVTLGGASLGGLAATYAHFVWPEVFGAALAMSPSFWVHDGAIDEVLSRRPLPAISKLYLDGGAHESQGQLRPRLMQVARLLRARGYPRSSLRLVIDPKGAHHERSWKRRLPAALRWLYPLG